jgi:hypothetical protein
MQMAECSMDAQSGCLIVAAGGCADRFGGATRPPRMPFAPVKEPVALPQLNIVTEYDFVATKRQMRPANQTKNRSP